MITLLLIFMAFIALGGGIYLFAIEHECNALINAKITNQEVMRIAREYNGRLSVGVLAQKTKLDFTEAERKLYIMLSEGIFHHEYDDNYQPVFVLNPSLPTRTASDSLPAPTRHEHLGVPASVVSDGEVIQIAVQNQGRITASMLCMKTKIQFEEAKGTLELLQRKGVFEAEVNENGTIIYTLPDWELLKGA
ncbi:MAG: hypothetical protein EAZ95_16225 [Bacteroidetes bacterium]|nr:MAG: hypothetical protein EAZ95_16225 [Bacteroidota bacterium]